MFLGIDPSTKKTGYCLMDENKDIILKGVIDLSHVTDHAEKLQIQYKFAEELFDKYDIESVLIEDQYYSNNADTLKVLARTSSVFLLCAKLRGINVSLIYPTSWRKAFHGNGKASKKDTFNKVVALYELNELKFSKDNDLTDSIGIAWAAADIHSGLETAV